MAWVIYDEVHYMRDKERCRHIHIHISKCIYPSPRRKHSSDYSDPYPLRGVVWEESIILLPHKVCACMRACAPRPNLPGHQVRFVFLSATIPNAKDFVSWVAKIHHQPCHVVYTVSYR